MQALLGFHVGFWDYVTFGAMAVIVLAFLALAVFILGLEPRLAVAIGGPISRMYFGSMFKSACKNLQSYVLKART